jgi:hypothetical protein
VLTNCVCVFVVRCLDSSGRSCSQTFQIGHYTRGTWSCDYGNGAKDKDMHESVHGQVGCCLFVVVCCLLFVVCCLLFGVVWCCCLLFVVCCLLFVVCCLLFVVSCFVSCLFVLQSIPKPSHRTLHSDFVPQSGFQCFECDITFERGMGLCCVCVRTCHREKAHRTSSDAVTGSMFCDCDCDISHKTE